MVDEKRTLWFLRKVTLFVDLPQQALVELLPHLETREARRRDPIYGSLEPSRSVLLVHGGRVRLSKVSADGKELTLAYRGPGELFGEQALLGEVPRGEAAEAVETALLSVVNREAFDALIRREASLGYKLSRMIEQRRRELELRLETLVWKDVHAKLAELLLGLGREHGIEDSRGTLLSLKITHQELANLIGSTRETVSLTLSQFKRSGLILMDERKIILKDLDGLRALV
jgi:CRP-like cAMP-binding protein